MEVKKSPKADLENKMSTWLFVGYVIVLAFIAASEWGKHHIKPEEESCAVDSTVCEKDTVPATDVRKQMPLASSKTSKSPVSDIDTQIGKGKIKVVEEKEYRDIEEKQKAVATDNNQDDEQDVFEVVEILPEFPGGQAALMQYLVKSIEYPKVAQENGIQGRVIVQFIVNKDGSIVDAKVVRSIDPSLDKEALRVINCMPKWHPAMQRGKPARARYTIPVVFRLQY